MIKIDLITGFLGAGKTTFLKQYAANLMKQGKKVGILENDFGAVNVDMLLLQELLGEQCDLEMVSGGCDRECHQRRFKTKLIAMGMRGFDRVIVEPSGIYDVDEFFDTLQEEPLDRWYEIGSVITIVDAGLPRELSREAEYLLASQLANAGQVVLSRTQEAAPEQLAATLEHLNRGLEQIHCDRRLGEEVWTKAWADLTPEDFDSLQNAGFCDMPYVKLEQQPEQRFQSLCFLEPQLSFAQLQAFAERILQDPACGTVLRVKGFLQGEKDWIEFNALRGQIQTRTLEKGQDVFIVIGEELKEEVIAAALEFARQSQ